MFSVIERPEFYVSQHNAKKLADTVQAWGYRARVWYLDSKDRTERGYAVAVFSNNGFEGYANAL